MNGLKRAVFVVNRVLTSVTSEWLSNGMLSEKGGLTGEMGLSDNDLG